MYYEDVLFQIWSKRDCIQRFYKQKQVTDIFTNDINKVAVSDRVSCSNGKDEYLAGHQTNGETIISLFIKTPKNIFSYDVSQYGKNSVYTMSFNIFQVKEWVLHYRNIWDEIETRLFEKLTTEKLNIVKRRS